MYGIGPSYISNIYYITTSKYVNILVHCTCIWTQHKYLYPYLLLCQYISTCSCKQKPSSEIVLLWSHSYHFSYPENIWCIDISRCECVWITFNKRRWCDITTVCESACGLWQKIFWKSILKAFERGLMSLVAKICGEEKRRLARQHPPSWHSCTYCTVLTTLNTCTQFVSAWQYHSLLPWKEVCFYLHLSLSAQCLDTGCYDNLWLSHHICQGPLPALPRLELKALWL